MLGDSPIAKRTLRLARKTAPKKCMAEEDTDLEGVKEAAASSDESGSEEEAEKGKEEAALKAAATQTDTPVRAAAAEAEAAEGERYLQSSSRAQSLFVPAMTWLNISTEQISFCQASPLSWKMLAPDHGAQHMLSSLFQHGAGEDSGDESDDFMPAIRYASDESDTDAEAEPAPESKKKGKKKGAASSDEDDDGDALLASRRSKGRKRGASRKAEDVCAASA